MVLGCLFWFLVVLGEFFCLVFCGGFVFFYVFLALGGSWRLLTVLIDSVYFLVYHNILWWFLVGFLCFFVVLGGSW